MSKLDFILKIPGTHTYYICREQNMFIENDIILISISRKNGLVYLVFRLINW